VRHRSRAPGEHEGPRRKGRRRKGRRCWCLCVCMRGAGVHVLGGELLHQSANLLLCPPRKVVTAALGRLPMRRAEQLARCSWTPRIGRQAWLAGGEAFGEAGEGRAEGEHSSAFSCRFCHGSSIWVRHVSELCKIVFPKYASQSNQHGSCLVGVPSVN